MHTIKNYGSPKRRKRKDEKTERPREFDGISFSSSSTPSRWFLLLLLRLLFLPGLDFASCASCPFQSQKEYRKMCSLFSPLFFRLSSQKRKGEVRACLPLTNAILELHHVARAHPPPPLSTRWDDDDDDDAFWKNTTTGETSSSLASSRHLHGGAGDARARRQRALRRRARRNRIRVGEQRDDVFRRGREARERGDEGMLGQIRRVVAAVRRRR